MLDKSKFVDLLTGLCEIFNKQPSKTIFNVYYEIFKDYSEQRIKNAVVACLKTHKYNTLPKPAELLEFLEESKEDKALRAWLYVIEAMSKGDYYWSIEFKDKIIHHCVEDLGGWMALCDYNKNELPFLEKRFLNLYRIYSKRELVKHPRLIGFIEAKNRERGFEKHIPKPIQIGYELETLKLTQKEAL